MAYAGQSLSGAKLVQYGYGQVEPNFLTAKRNGQVFAQLPAAANIDMLENGQFVKYDYEKGVCDFDTGDTSGPWRMVFNEVKVYRDRETDADFAMLKRNYNARVYSPVGQTTHVLKTVNDYTGAVTRENTEEPYIKSVETFNVPQMMPDGTKMVPRVIAVPTGDIWTTNTVNAEITELSVGTELKIGAKGYLEVGSGAGGDNDPKFVVVKVYTMPDLQPGVKIQRVG